MCITKQGSGCRHSEEKKNLEVELERKRKML